MKVDIVTFLLIQAVIGLGILLWRLMKKSEKQENIIIKQQEKIDNIQYIIDASNIRLTQLDISGAFKSDDEVGFFFENLKAIQDELNKA